MQPYPEQLEAVREAKLSGSGGIVMPTGAGKSITMALLINEFQLRTLVVVPNLELKKQLSETFIKVFGSLNNITIENIDSPRLKTAIGYDLLIIDECHKSAAATYRKLNKNQWSGIYHRFYFTATFFRNDPEEQLLFESVVGQSVYELTYDQAVSRNLIVPVEAYYIQLPKQETYIHSWAQVYSSLVVNNQGRNETISNLLKSLEQNNVYTLCLVKEVAHGKILSKLSGVPFVSGEDEDSRQFIRQFNSGGIKTLIGTVGVLGEGIDTKPAEYIVIAGLGKARSQFMQAVGRGVRTYPGKESAKIVIIKDNSHKFTLRHYNAQAKILKEEYGVKPVKLEL